MFATKKDIREIYTFLKKLQGKDLYISGQCLLPQLNFEYFFLGKENRTTRPVFLLKPEKSNVTLILILGGDVKDFADGQHLSQDKKTILYTEMNNGSSMYIFKADDFDADSLWKIIACGATDKGIIDRAHEVGVYRNELCKRIVDVGLILTCELHVTFAATFDHEQSNVGRFTLAIDKLNGRDKMAEFLHS